MSSPANRNEFSFDEALLTGTQPGVVGEGVLRRTVLARADLAGAVLSPLKLRDDGFHRCSFREAGVTGDLSGVVFSECDFTAAEFSVRRQPYRKP